MFLMGLRSELSFHSLRNGGSCEQPCESVWSLHSRNHNFACENPHIAFFHVLQSWLEISRMNQGYF